MITETCSVCGSSFDVVFRYQMEEKNGGFAFYCSQKCLEKSQKGGDDGSVSCDACMKRFTPDLVSQVLYVGGKRRYACCLGCRSQLIRESQGARLGDLASEAKRQATAAPQEIAPAGAVPADEPAAPVLSPEPAPARPPPGVTATPAGKAAPVVSPAPAPAATRAAPVVTPAPAATRPTPIATAPSPASISVRPPATSASSIPPVTGPLSQPPPSQGAPNNKAPATRSGRARREDAPPGASTRSSGLMAAIRPEVEDASSTGAATAAAGSKGAPAGASSRPPPGTVIPIVPPLKGEKPPAPAPNSAPRRIAVFNHKGGTGKTTTAVSIAAGLAAKGKKVLLVDTDAQGNVSVSLGAGSERSLYHVLVMGLQVKDAVKEVRPNLDLLPSNETLAAAELYLAGRQNRDRVLADRLNTAASDYDYVVLDCSPSLSLMNQNALVFADSVLVPVACDYLSLVGVRQVLKTVKNVNSLLHHPVQIWGVLPTFFDGRAKICNEAVGTLKEHFGDKCLPPIRAAIKVKEAPSVGQTIFEYAAGSNAAEDYGIIVDRILGMATAGRSEEPAREPQGPPARASATA